MIKARHWMMGAAGLLLVVVSVWQILAAGRGLETTTIRSTRPPLTIVTPADGAGQDEGMSGDDEDAKLHAEVEGLPEAALPVAHHVHEGLGGHHAAQQGDAGQQDDEDEGVGHELAGQAAENPAQTLHDTTRSLPRPPRQDRL